MARATAHCHCDECGVDFVKEKKNCYSRKEADSWESWAESNIHLCPKCSAKAYYAEQKEKLAEVAAKYADKLPTFEGSEKQIAYASDLRIKRIAEDEGNIELMCKLINRGDVDDEKIDKALRENTLEWDLIVAYKLLTEKSAAEIIELLKRR